MCTKGSKEWQTKSWRRLKGKRIVIILTYWHAFDYIGFYSLERDLATLWSDIVGDLVLWFDSTASSYKFMSNRSTITK